MKEEIEFIAIVMQAKKKYPEDETLANKSILNDVRFIYIH